MKKILGLMVLGCMSFHVYAESTSEQYWVKTHEPMKVVAWIKKDQNFINMLCGEISKDIAMEAKTIGCTIRPDAPVAEIFKDKDGAVIYSIYKEGEAKRRDSCDGMSLYDHEVYHVTSGMDHYGKCPKTKE